VKESTTFCRICEAACGLKVRCEGAVVTGIEPDRDHVSSRGYACIKGMTAHEFRDSPDRITRPLKRTATGYQPIPWDVALAEIGARLSLLKRRRGADSIGVYLGNPPSMSFLPPLFVSGFMAGLGSSKLYHTGSQDCNNKFVVAQRLYGSAQLQPFPDIPRTQCLIALGSNPVVSKMSFINLPHPLRQLRQIEERGGRVVWVNPRRTETARQVGEQVFIRPDSDVFFMLAFLHEVLARGAEDGELVRRTMCGLDALRALVQPWPPERVAEVTGIAPEVQRELVDAYLAADGAALYCSTGVNQGSNGTVTFWLQEVVNAITGNLDRAGGCLVGKGVLDASARTAFEPGAELETARIGGVPLVMGTTPAGLLADDILTPGPGQLRSLLMVGGNPLLTCANSRRLERAFDELDLLVAIDLVRNESARRADYILPAGHWLERPDIPFLFMSSMGTMPEPWFQYSDAVLPLAGEAREEAWILLQLAGRTGSPLFDSRVLQRALAWAYGRGDTTLGSQRVLGLLARLARQGGLCQLRRQPHGRRLPPNRPGSFLGQRLLTPDGLLQLAPPDLLALTARVEAHFAAAQHRGAGELRLISKRERFSHNTWTHNHPSFVRGERGTNYLFMHPADAEQRGLVAGDRVRVSSEGGTLEVPVSVTEDMMPGAVSLPHGWGHATVEGLSVARRHAGANVNILASDGVASLEPLSGMSPLNGIVVAVSKVQAPPAAGLEVADA
jgi:anaerobic selenocysteine-containing dehydrogenase